MDGVEGGLLNSASDVAFARLDLTFHLAGHLFDCALEVLVFLGPGGCKIKSVDLRGLCLDGRRDVLIEGNLNMDVIVLDLRIRIVLLFGSSMAVIRLVRLDMLHFLRSLVLSRRIESRSRNRGAILRVLRELLLV